MREIKFRAWDTSTDKGMSAPFYIGDIAQGYDCNYNVDFPFDVAYASVIMQYTGTEDKNGVEIYEGDIVRRLETDWVSQPDDDTRSLEEYLNGLAYVGSVIFLNKEWYIESCGDFNVGQHGFIEVIGNIYENPELLKES